MSIKPNYSWWIILGLVVAATTLGGCLLPSFDYVRHPGVVYTWTDVPRYNGRTVYFNRYGKPMVYRSGYWYHVPRSAVRYNHYRAYYSRVQLCRSGARNTYYTRYCGRSGMYRRVYARNRYGSLGYRSYPRTRRTYRVRRTRRSPRYRSKTTRRYRSGTTRSYGNRRTTTYRRTTPKRRYRYHGSGRRYDSRGRYSGRMDKNGRRYDSRGRYRGRVDRRSGRSYDSRGRYTGRTDRNGRRYDSRGRYTGRTDKNGRRYDSRGRYKGRIDKNGRIYDSRGRYKGRVKGR